MTIKTVVKSNNTYAGTTKRIVKFFKNNKANN